MKRFRLFGWMAMMVLVVMLAACSGSDSAGETLSSALTEEQAAEIATSAMEAFNAGDYAGWSRDWSAAMKGAIGEEDFLAYREQVLAQLGEFQSIESITLAPGSSNGFVRWVAVTKFENGRMQFGFGFEEDGREVTGVFPEVVS